MDKITVKAEFLPAVSPREVCLMFQKARTHAIHGTEEGVTKGLPDQHRCSIAYLTVFQGLFDEVGFNQHEIMTNAFTGMSDAMMLEKVYSAIVSLGGPIRLAIKKYVDSDGKFRYTKYVDFDADKVLTMGSEMDLKHIIYMLIQACDLEGVLVPKADDSWDKDAPCHKINE